MKSPVSDLLRVVMNIYNDIMAKCAVDPDSRDLDTIKTRTKDEGLSFLTITLPSFGKDFESCLSSSMVEPGLFRSFRKRLKIPAFLQGIFALVFDVGTGRLLPYPSIPAIEGIRQISYTFKKLEVPCNPKRIKEAFDEYVQIEHNLSTPLSVLDEDYFSEVSSLLWKGLSEDFSSFDLIPKHGPGATAEHISGNQKYADCTWYDRLELDFPVLSFKLPLGAFESPEFESLTVVSEDCELPVRVITVPKTLKGPRIIAIEPVCMQYTQQAVSSFLMKRLDEFWLTSGHVNFTDQTINQTLAMKSSKDGRLATLDLSSASDRVPLSLVTTMLSDHADLLHACLASRSKRAQLPSGLEIDLLKFASMGSALCFPIESMYFYTLCVGALLRFHNLPVTSTNIYCVSRDVYVYGDDIIVPADAAADVISFLQKYYCKVGLHKSFWTGKFRESCGVEAYDGENVVPTYLRRLLPNHNGAVQEIISCVKTSNQFYRRGYWHTAFYLREKVERLLGELPVVGDDCPGLGWVSYMKSVSLHRWNKLLHRFEVLTYVPVPVKISDDLDGYPALAKSLLSLECSRDTQTDKDHLARSVRRGAVTLKRRWTVPI